MTQSTRILHALQQGRRLTPIDALREFHCFRLGARIWDLKRQGYDIRTKIVQVSPDTRVAEYYIQDPENLTSVTQNQAQC